MNNYAKKRINMLINIIGASGSGKTTLARKLEEYPEFNIIQSYTTRPKREPEEYGHRFITKDEYNRYSKDKMIAHARLYGHEYFALDEQVLPGKYNIYVVNPEGAEQAKLYYKNSDVEVLTIYLEIPDHVRVVRREDIPDRLEEDAAMFDTVAYDVKLDASKAPILVLRDFLALFD